jgi:hypothetical protein
MGAKRIGSSLWSQDIRKLENFLSKNPDLNSQGFFT